MSRTRIPLLCPEFRKLQNAGPWLVSLL